MTRYNYHCCSKSGTVLTGIVSARRSINNLNERDELITKVMSEIASIVHIAGMPWDPFNVNLIVQAQIEPELMDPETFSEILQTKFEPVYVCPVCGATDKKHLCK